MDTQALRGKIIGKYKTQTGFAKTIGWHPNKVSQMLTGKYTPNVNDVATVSQMLNLTLEEHAAIFLNQKSPNGVKLKGCS